MLKKQIPPSDELSARKESTLVMIPTYNNAGTLEDILRRTLRHSKNLLVVNDGSLDGTADILARFPQVAVLHQAVNRGKGLALRLGIEWALARGYRHLITLDADGQHYPEDIPLFLEASRREARAIWVGHRDMRAAGAPLRSRFGFHFSNFWFRFETGVSLPDTQSGFRLYPLDWLHSTRFFTRKYEFEVEILVRAAWKNIPLSSVNIRSVYKKGGVSHFRPIRDFGRVSLLNTVLVGIALLYRWPLRLAGVG